MISVVRVGELLNVTQPTANSIVRDMAKIGLLEETTGRSWGSVFSLRGVHGALGRGDVMGAGGVRRLPGCCRRKGGASAGGCGSAGAGRALVRGTRVSPCGRKWVHAWTKARGTQATYTSQVAPLVRGSPGTYSRTDPDRCRLASLAPGT
jgi:hypothetical protein